ncbi:tripartite tricarboxylate transporter substrate binding protein [Bosea sp. BK604]|uniref:Bug family tripartite tricarboxylate transporter substrate binding protein n=1 Tax=Bosea sp. BK604 TaxID=2512180 RepID=UPI00104E105D|nr:tripartite tricarboxylate transporter substrate binding protein [Bosea sp. BK604]TCR62728.1 tripartite-type tricarboxylate transporter receptor subunit TctC [Bosea sp. BK604]
MSTSGYLDRRSLLAGFSAASLTGLAGTARAQASFPTRPITLVVPFAAGGSTDIVARLVGQKMAETLGQSVVIENRAGAGGNVGATAVARAQPDGYTILMGTIATHALNPAILKAVTFDPVKDFTPISLLAVVPNVMVVNPSFPAKTVQEVIKLLKENPGKYSYASSGVGTPLHLSGELFKSLGGVNMNHVPYRGAGPALNDVVSGAVPIMFDNLPSSAQFIRNGQLRAIGVTTKERVASFPELPTIAEGGLAGYETYTWNALFGPANLPKPILERLNTEANKALTDATVKQRLNDVSAQIIGSTPEALGEHVKLEVAKWAPIAKASGATIE